MDFAQMFGGGFGGGGQMDPIIAMMAQPNAMFLMQLGYRPVPLMNGGLTWLPKRDPEADLPSNLRMAAIQESMAKSKAADSQKYMNETVMPAYSQASAAQSAMGNRGSFGAQTLADILKAGQSQADNFGEEASGRAFSNLVNLRNQYLNGIQMSNQEQDRQYQGLGDALQLARQQQQLQQVSSAGGGSDFQSGYGNVTRGRSLMQGLQGLSNMASQNRYINQGYRQGGLFGAAAAVPRAAGNILFGL